MELIPISLVGGALSVGEIRGSCVPWGSLCSPFIDGWGCDPTWIVTWPGASQQLTDGWVQIFPKWPPPEKGMVVNIPESFAYNILPPQQATFTHIFPGGAPRISVRIDPDSYGEFALSWDPVHVKVCVHLPRMGSPIPPVPWSSHTRAPLAFNARCSRDSFSQCHISTRGSLMWGLELSLL